MQISAYRQAEAMKGGTKLDKSAKNDESLLPKRNKTLEWNHVTFGNLRVTEEITAVLLKDSRPFVMVTVFQHTRLSGAGEGSNCRLEVLNSAQEGDYQNFSEHVTSLTCRVWHKLIVTT